MAKDSSSLVSSQWTCADAVENPENDVERQIERPFQTVNGFLWTIPIFDMAPLIDSGVTPNHFKTNMISE